MDAKAILRPKDAACIFAASYRPVQVKSPQSETSFVAQTDNADSTDKHPKRYLGSPRFDARPKLLMISVLEYLVQ